VLAEVLRLLPDVALGLLEEGGIGDAGQCLPDGLDQERLQVGHQERRGVHDLAPLGPVGVPVGVEVVGVLEGDPADEDPGRCLLLAGHGSSR
jgi:hypothetical protein